jgi:hypothetical protein
MSRKKPNPVRPGEIFGLLTVITIVKDKKPHRNTVYNCRCVCGNMAEVVGVSLRAGATNSCGCKRRNMKRKAPGEVTWNRIFKQYKTDAAKKNKPFLLSFGDFKEIAAKNCWYCGEPPFIQNFYKKSIIYSVDHDTIERATILANGIDRVDSNEGYILTNCRPCCTVCNRMKLDHDDIFFQKHILKISNFLKRRINE